MTIFRAVTRVTALTKCKAPSTAFAMELHPQDGPADSHYNTGIAQDEWRRHMLKAPASEPVVA
jgi:hypothetical protein